MISGRVNNGLEAEIPLTVRGPSGETQRVHAVIDTGYDGHLTLPPAVIAKLGLVWDQTASATLGDGSETTFEMYVGAVIWDRRKRTIAVDEADTTPLIGTALLADYKLQASFRPGGDVRVTALTRKKA